MASQLIYKVNGLVLRRTKLGEQDLILTILTDESEQVRAVAKGARKPSSKLAGISNLGNEAEFVIRQGKSLDTINEATLLTSRADIAADYERATVAEAMLDIACLLTVEGEHHTKLLPLTSTALDAICTARITLLPLVVAAYTFKACAMQGYRPSFDTCVRCGASFEGDTSQFRGFSFEDGGVVCSDCMATADRLEPVAVLDWCHALLRMRFSELLGIEGNKDELRFGLGILDIARTWIHHYPGIKPKALDFVLDEGLFELM